ncbi:MAG: RHS repeat domain-containing protein [Syntrophobacteraceae bacterium]
MIKVTDWLGGQATYAYDQDGRLATLTQFNGIVTTYSYDAASRLTGMGSAAASCQFTLDGDGNRVNSAETEPLSATASNGVSAVYTYNTQKDRLLSAGPLSYTYDNEGQLVNSGGTCLTFDYNHRLVEVGSDTQFSYDGRGNRLSATRAGVTTGYIYDPLTYRVSSDTHEQCAVVPRPPYSDIPRVARQAPGTGAWGNLMADADSNGVTHKYIYGRGLLAVATSNARYCYHFNGTGSTVAITDMNQNIVNSYAYDPFGTVLSQQETVPQPFKYVGQFGVMAEPNGLYYMRARYYDPSVGRFISEDPLGFGGGDVNLYAYILNNPVNSTDPGGLAPNDKTYGLPKDFWNWYHRNIKKPGDPDLSKEEAEVYYEEWKALGQPGPDHKGKSRCEGMPEYNPYAPYFPYDPFFLPIMPLPFNPSLPSIPGIGPLPFPIEPLPVVP